MNGDTPLKKPNFRAEECPQRIKGTHISSGDRKQDKIYSYFSFLE